MRNDPLAPAQLEPVLSVHFFCTESGNEPVRHWLRELDASERKAIGEEIKTVQIGWPLGMPLVRKLARDLWEVRIRLPLRIARVIFTIEGGAMVLLHGFIKKSQATPQEDMALAKERLRALMNG
ncbi:type II toxin-antitoxin system RelE/ParE family toxin [Paraburkholderia bannensis]|uniref:type II toxin-antitoxin system RelE/ParE family toxin n=1 Tax=Paraburkholderia bannensis TaxID=765414 RepID=UPI002ABD94BD|nr:type II toxin-antitoxin system RelE/ParE family toxin [Paraburkholderia bannensis]